MMIDDVAFSIGTEHEPFPTSTASGDQVTKNDGDNSGFTKDGQRTESNIPLPTRLLIAINSSIVAVIIPVFLATCFITTMLGVVCIFIALFLYTKLCVLQVFLRECSSIFIVLAMFINGVHVAASGLTGISGLGRRRWLLAAHLFLSIGLVLMLSMSLLYEKNYYKTVMGELEVNMWSSLSRTRSKNDTLSDNRGWNYIQYHVQCCGINSYLDWCEAPQMSTNAFSMNKSNIVRCFIPESCSLNENKDNGTILFRCLLPKIVPPNPSNLHSRGCYTLVLNLIDNFMQGYVSIGKFTVFVMMIDIPLCMLVLS